MSLLDWFGFGFRTSHEPRKPPRPLATDHLKQQADDAGSQLRKSAAEVRRSSSQVSGMVVSDIMNSRKVVEAASQATKIMAALRGEREDEKNCSQP
jgi:hypothetical protein